MKVGPQPARYAHGSAAGWKRSPRRTLSNVLRSVPPEAREKSRRQFRRAVETGAPTDFETVVQTDASGYYSAG